MKKKKQVKQQAKKEDKPVTLGDMLNKDLMSQLKAKQQELKEKEEKEKQQQKEEALRKKREEQRLREKNMSFEELLAQSEMDWKKFK
ncbi:YqkE family protein [Bacillus sp. FJAT-27251]|uniref:YqkE family protein n=1 Tax=Bacillus sp. FJAT-27251 TaxID=1684142 RepID=UPI0006A7E6AD|nr:YqkE family protein [Bacillus sp. FJAT-27251]